MTGRDPADLLAVVDRPTQPRAQFADELFERLVHDLERPRALPRRSVRTLVVALALLALCAGIATATYVLVRVASPAHRSGILTLATGGGNGAATISALTAGGRLRTVWECPRKVFCGDLTSLDWSPDGRYVAFTLDEIGGRSAYIGLHIVDARTGRDLHVPDLHLAHPYATVQTDAVLRRAVRTTLARLGCRFPSAVAWSPDGRRLAYACGKLYTIRRDGTGRRALVTGGAPGAIDPSWSPDGTRIVFASGRSVHSSLFVVNADGSGLHRLARDASRPSWSPDGSTIAYDSPNGVRLVSPAGVPRSGGAPAGAPRWSPDGSQLAVQTAQGVLLVDARTWRATRVTAETGAGPLGAARPAWYPGREAPGVPSPPRALSGCSPC